MTPATEARLKLLLTRLDAFFNGDAHIPPAEFEAMTAEVKVLKAKLEEDCQQPSEEPYFRG